MPVEDSELPREMGYYSLCPILLAHSPSFIANKVLGVTDFQFLTTNSGSSHYQHCHPHDRLLGG